MRCVFFAIAITFVGVASHGHAATESKPATGKTRVLVMGLSGLGIRPELSKNLEQYLRTSIGTIEGFAVVPPTDLQIALSEPRNKAAAACSGGNDCAILAGKAVRADVVVFGAITALGTEYSLNVRALSVKDGKEIAKQLATLSGSRDLLIPETRLAAYRLMAPDKIKGWLVVEVDVADADVEIDGKLVGKTPLAKPIDDLAPGAHLVVIRRPGFQPFQQEFTIRPFEQTRLKLTFDKKS